MYSSARLIPPVKPVCPSMTQGPPYQNTSAEYLPLGEVKFRRMLEELEKAEHFKTK